MFQLPFLLTHHLTLPGHTLTLSEADPSENTFAVLQPTQITIVQADYMRMKLTRLRKISHSGLKYQKLISLEPGIQLIVAQRVLSDAKDVVQTVFMRVVLNMDPDIDEQTQEDNTTGDIEEILHFDLAVHQCVKHPLFAFEKLPYLIVQSYTQVMALNVKTMSLSQLFRLQLDRENCRMSFN
jgi:hypothetical protein